MKVQNIGHIKIGGLVRGEPALFKKIRLTELYKEGSDNFIVRGDTEKSGYDEIKVTLPFVAYPKMNFSVKEMSFVKINDFYKYMAFLKDGKVYLEPYQPDFGDPINTLPTILLGDAEKWEKNLDISTKAICYFNVFHPETGEELGVFDFKTMSAHSIESMRNTFEILSKVPVKKLANVKMSLRIIRKIFESEKNDEVAYLDLILPSFNQIVSYSYSLIGSITEEDVAFRKEMEEVYLLDEDNRIKNAITSEEAKKFFGGRFVVSIDKTEMFEFANLKQMTPPGQKEIVETKKKRVKKEEEEIGFTKKDNKVKTTKTNREILREHKDLVLKLKGTKKEGIGLVLARKMVLAFGENALKIAEQNGFKKEKIEKILN